MHKIDLSQFTTVIQANVRHALEEDIGDGDITAQLIAANTQAQATVISRDRAVICGRPWVDEVFQQIDPAVKVEWQIREGDLVDPNQVLFTLKGNARSLLTGERAALNFLQTLSGTASKCHRYSEMVKHTQCKLLDTRKTLPGLRIAQKYAVSQGGCFNHRIGLYDAYLIKENHIAACGGIARTVEVARHNAPGKPVEVEVETMAELQQAFAAKADIIMLDNFPLEEMRQAVAMKPEGVQLEASGGVTDETLPEIAATGVDFVSLGTLTKDCQAVDLSMRLSTEG